MHVEVARDTELGIATVHAITALEIVNDLYVVTISSYAYEDRSRVLDRFEYQTAIAPAENPDGDMAQDATYLILRAVTRMGQPLQGGIIRQGFSNDPQFLDETADVWKVDLARLSNTLRTRVKAEAEERRAVALSEKTTKMLVYAGKVQEIAAWTALGEDDAARQAAVDAMGADARVRFPFATVEAELRGEAGLATIIAEMSGASDQSTVEVSRIEAIEQVTCRAIDLAATAEEKRAIASSIDWNWQPTEAAA